MRMRRAGDCNAVCSAELCLYTQVRAVRRTHTGKKPPSVHILIPGTFLR